MAFPTSLDSFTTKTDSVDDVAAADINNVQTAVVALETKIGIDSSLVATSLDYLVKSGSSTDPGHLHPVAKISGLIDLIYPVGSIYTSIVSTNPNTLFGTGTWAAFGAGKVLVGLNGADTDFDTAEETGGVKTVTLTAAQSGLPSHTHGLAGGTGAATYASSAVPGDTSIANTTATGGTAASEAHSNLQPYIVVYMWKRTA